MFCPHCGHHIVNERVAFCPYCGLKVDYTPATEQSYPQDRNFAQTGRKPKAKTWGWALAVCIVLLLVIVGVAGSIPNSPENNVISKKTEVQMITDDTYFELSGDFLQENGVFTVSLTNDNKIAFALDDSISSNYDYYSWWLFDEDHVASTNTTSFSAYTGENLSKAEPVLYYLDQKPGVYDVSVKCYTTSPDGQQVYAATYSGTVTYVGYITETYAWAYNGTVYNAQVTFRYDEYRLYRDMNTGGRAVTDYSKVASFVTYDDPTVVSLAESLLNAYGAGRDTSGQDFASFVLAFVQICFEYPPHSATMEGDKYQYGQDEYFAYPMEVIYYGMGDCEDTSVLAAALFKDLGFDAGVVIVPGHALAAVGLDQYSPGPYSPQAYEIISQQINGVTYYACETTVDTFQAIGLVTTSGDSGHLYSWYIGKDNYGFYPV